MKGLYKIMQAFYHQQYPPSPPPTAMHARPQIRLKESPDGVRLTWPFFGDRGFKAGLYDL